MAAPQQAPQAFRWWSFGQPSTCKDSSSEARVCYCSEPHTQGNCNHKSRSRLHVLCSAHDSLKSLRSHGPAINEQMTTVLPNARCRASLRSKVDLGSSTAPFLFACFGYRTKTKVEVLQRGFLSHVAYLQRRKRTLCGAATIFDAQHASLYTGVMGAAKARSTKATLPLCGFAALAQPCTTSAAT
eukprot:1589883-Amphidinium_carterae.1